LCRVRLVEVLAQRRDDQFATPQIAGSAQSVHRLGQIDRHAQRHLDAAALLVVRQLHGFRS
jgi:hypothetical protein